ncbi:head-tail connector protein [Heyndrickxia faecalis]|uniref:head-tail connector protein n=1 Tax=Heyndrickxia faecalis TaxID=2824910 RepID=UPI0031017DC4
MDEMITKLKSHLQWEEGMDDSMLSFYIQSATKYVQRATGGQSEYLVLLVAGIMYEYRVSEDELGKALDAITPFIVQEVFGDAETTNE